MQGFFSVVGDAPTLIITDSYEQALIRGFVESFTEKYLCDVLLLHKYFIKMVAFYQRGVVKVSDTTNLSIRIDRGLKDEADYVFNEMGMNLTTAITIFVKQVVRQKKIPFEIAIGTDKNLSLSEIIAASERIWENSAQVGTAEMSMDDIDREIKASRAERRAKGIHP